MPQEKSGINVKAFAEGVAEQIREYLPPEYGETKFEVMQQKKNNGVVRTGIRIDRPGEHLSPVIGMEGYYEEVRQGKPLADIIKGVADEMQGVLENLPHPEQIKLEDYDVAKEFLSVQLINTKANRSMLAEMPHRKMEDLSLICILKFSMDGGNGTVKVRHEIAEKWNVSEEELFRAALENAQEKDAAILKPMEAVLGEILGIKYETENLLEEEPAGKTRQVKDHAFILMNHTRSMGAAVLAYPDTMEKISRLFPEGFYILPSSIQEVLIMPKDGQDVKQLGEMVRDVNRKAVEKIEVLSDRVYEYDKERNRIRQVPESIERKQVIER